MSEEKISLHDGHMPCHIFRSSHAKRTSLILIQDISATHQAIQSLCQRLAESGYLVACPDLFWRSEPAIGLDNQSTQNLYERFDIDQGVKDLKTCLTYLRQHKGGNGHVGCIGHSLGGLLAYLMVTRTDIDCAISYYGFGIENYLKERSRIRTPFMLHIVGQGRSRQAIREAFDSFAEVTSHAYPEANQGFAIPRGETYHKQAADIAFDRDLAFLMHNLQQ